MVDPVTAAEKRVVSGSTVRVQFSDQTVREFTIVAAVGSSAPEQGTISQESPLARALIGRAVGEQAVYMVGDRMIIAEVIAIE